MGQWLTLGVDGWIDWPNEEAKLEYADHKLVLRPKSKDDYPTVSILLNGMNEKQARILLNEFLSILSWIDGQPAELTYGLISICPSHVGKPNKMSHIKPKWAFEAFKREPLKDAKQKLALALYREAVTVNSIPYSFLSFFKIIGICIGENKESSIKLNEFIQNLSCDRAAKRISKLKHQGIDDIAKYLYKERRCAISHVADDPVVNPDDEDSYELYDDIYIVRAVAEYLIEHELIVSKDFWLIG